MKGLTLHSEHHFSSLKSSEVSDNTAIVTLITQLYRINIQCPILKLLTNETGSYFGKTVQRRSLSRRNKIALNFPVNLRKYIIIILFLWLYKSCSPLTNQATAERPDMRPDEGAKPRRVRSKRKISWHMCIHIYLRYTHLIMGTLTGVENLSVPVPFNVRQRVTTGSAVHSCILPLHHSDILRGGCDDWTHPHSDGNSGINNLYRRGR